MLRLNLFLLLIIGLTAHAQRKEPTQQQAENAFRNAKTIDQFSFIEGSAMYDFLSKKDIGEIVIQGKDLYKIMNHQDIKMHRYGCLYLKSEVYSPEEIIREKEGIISAYNKGTPFETIIEQYYYPGKAKELANITCARTGMLENMGTDLDTGAVGDIFTDESEEGLYIVVKNTEPYYLKAVEALHIIYTKQLGKSQ